MTWVVDFLTGGRIVADGGDFDAGGARTLTAAGHAIGELGFKGNDLALVRTTIGRARRLSVGDILGDEIEPRFLSVQRAAGGAYASDEFHGRIKED